MDRSKKPFLTGSYNIPSFVIKKEAYDPMYDEAIIRKGKDGKLHFFRIDEGTSEEYEVDANQVWADLSDNFAAGPLSHDLIPACQIILEEDGWKEEDFDSLYWLALHELVDYQDYYFDGGFTPSEALKEWPKTHDDWLAVMLQAWEARQPFNFNCYPDRWNKSRRVRFICNYNYLISHIKSGLTLVKKTKRGYYNRTKAYLDLQNAIHDLIAISPARKSNKKEIKTLAKCKRLYPKLMSKIIPEVLEILQARPGLDREEKYMAEISEFMNKIDQAMDEFVEPSDSTPN